MTCYICAQVTPNEQPRATAPVWFEKTRENAWLLPYDTTLITRRALSELSYESHDNDDEFWKIETSLRGAYALGEDLAFLPSSP